MRIAGKRFVVVGASSGIGAALARALAMRGARVAVVARRGDELAKLVARVNPKCKRGMLIPYPHDVAESFEVPALFQQITSDLGGLDGVIYAAGVMPRIAPNEYDFTKDRHMADVNFIGAVAWLNEAAMRFTRTRSGHIVAIGSIAGDRGRRGNPVYGASKNALATYLESLRNRLGQHGVAVTTIKPGFVDTAMTEGLPGLFWLVSPDEAARMILNAMARRATVAYVPARWELVSLVVRSIPSMIFRRLNF